MIIRCETCKKEEDCRPYGTNGAQICFDCMTASPEREREAEHQFRSQLMAAAEVGDFVVIDGISGMGPRPIGGSRQ